MKIPAETLPTVNPSATPLPNQRINVTPDQFGGLIGQAEQRSSATLASASDEMARTTLARVGLINETMATEADTNFNKAMSASYSKFNALKGKDAIDALPKFQDDLQQLQQQYRASLNPEAARMFDQSSRRMMGYMQMGAARYADGQRDKWMLDASQSRANNAIDLAIQFRSDPAQVQLQLNTGQGEIAKMGEQLGWDKDTADYKKGEYAGKLLRSTIDAVRQDDGDAAQKMYAQFKDRIPGAYQAAIEADLARGASEQDAVFRGSVEDRFKNNIAAFYNTGSPSLPLSEAEIRKAFPADKYGDRADHMLRQLTGAAQVGDATRDMALTSPQEDEAKVAAFSPKLGAPDYGDQIDRQNAVVQAYNEKYKALAKDPAAYVLGASPQIAAKNVAALTNPAAMSDYVAALNAAYDKLGVPPGSRPVLPATQAQSLAKSIASDPEGAPMKLKQLQQQFGPAWDDVWHTLTTAGKLPAAYQAVGTLDNERDASLLARAISEQGKTGKSWGDILGSKPENDIKTAVRSDPTVQSLLSSLSRSGAPATQVDAILGSIDTLAYAKMFYDRDPRPAQSAIESFTSKYEFMPNGGARVPADLMPQVSANARVTLDGLKPDGIAVPAVYGKPGMPAADEYTDLIKSAPSWITSPKADSLWLMDPYGRLVRDRMGNPLAVPFSAPMPAVPGGASPWMIPPGQ